MGNRPWDDEGLTIETDREDWAFVTHKVATDLGR